MTTKTFRAPDTQTALAQIQEELGPDAIIVSVRQVPGGAAWQAWRKTEVEVVAIPGVTPPTKAESPARPTSAPSMTPSATPSQTTSPVKDERLESLMSQLAERLQERTAAEQSGPADQPEKRMGEKSVKAAAPAATSSSQKQQVGRQPEHQPERQPEAEIILSKTLLEMKNRLATQGVDTALGEKVIRTCAEALSPRALDDERRVQNHIGSQLKAFLRSEQLVSQASLKSGEPKTICLIGPSGAGKTSACAKLAAYFSAELAYQVVWVSADTVRTGAISLARSYTDLLGIPLRLAYTSTELAEVVRSESGADLILVDTPACNPRSKNDVIALGALLTALPGRITYLVAPATVKEADLREELAAYGAFNLKGLILTKLDETDFYGSCFNLAWRSQLPLAYFSTGPRVIDDFLPADANQLAELLVGARLMEAQRGQKDDGDAVARRR
jgi:flagellar biosynthesis protein FlhF